MIVQQSASQNIEARISGFRLADMYTRQIANAFSGTVESQAPRDTGWMAGAASRMIKSAQPGRISYKVGPFSELGNPRKRAPRNTIRAFLEDYPQYRDRTLVKTKTNKPRKRLRRKPFPGAWHFLSAEAKNKLKALRRAGMYGTDGPSPRYWQAIVEYRVPGMGGNMGGDDFLEDAYIVAYAASIVLERNVFGK